MVLLTCSLRKLRRSSKGNLQLARNYFSFSQLNRLEFQTCLVSLPLVCRKVLLASVSETAVASWLMVLFSQCLVQPFNFWSLQYFKELNPSDTSVSIHVYSWLFVLVLFFPILLHLAKYFGGHCGCGTVVSLPSVHRCTLPITKFCHLFFVYFFQGNC